MFIYLGKLVLCGAVASLGAYTASQIATADSPTARVKPIPPVLMYHEVRNLAAERAAGEPSRPLETSDVTIEAFRGHMTYLSQHFTTISTQELYDYLTADKPLPPRPVLITLDDGYLGNFNHGAPVMDTLGLKATFFVHTKYVGTMRGNPTTPTSYDHMDWEQLRFLAANERYEVFSHTMTHPRLTTLSDENLDGELRISKQVLERELGLPAPFLAYPFGAHDKRVIDAAKKYYAMAFIVSRPVQNISAIFQIPRLIVGKESINVSTFKCRVNRWELGREPNGC